MNMSSWPLKFLVVVLPAALFCPTGIAAVAAEIAKVLSSILLFMFLAAVTAGRRRI